MVEKYKGQTPDGKDIGTWYHLSRTEVLQLVDNGHTPLEKGQTREDIIDADLLALPGQEIGLERLIQSWGLTIIRVRQG